MHDAATGAQTTAMLPNKLDELLAAAISLIALAAGFITSLQTHRTHLENSCGKASVGRASSRDTSPPAAPALLRSTLQGCRSGKSLGRTLLSCGFCCLAAAILFAPPLSAQTQQAPQESPSKPPFPAVDLFRLSLTTLKDTYIEPLDEEALTAAALKAMLASLDSHSTYMTAAEFADFQTNISGKFGGIGVTLEAQAGTIRVVSPVGGAPAARAGVEPGWTVQAIEGASVAQKSLSDVVRMLRGKPGQPVSVTFHDAKGQAVALTLKREDIQLHSVFHKRFGTVGYLRINSFTATTDEELGKHLDELGAKAQLSGLILDLRNNAGGHVESAVACASRFLESGLTVMRAGRNAAAARSIAASDRGPAWRTIPLVVLVNSGTASASEIVAGALQDHGRAKILGTTTFGKGLMQTVLPIDNGAVGAFSITNQRYYSPKGRSIQQIGIVPDLMVARNLAEAKSVTDARAFSEASLAHPLANEEKARREPITAIEAPIVDNETSPVALFRESVPSDADALLDYQLRRALNLLAPYAPPLGPLPPSMIFQPVAIENNQAPPG